MRKFWYIIFFIISIRVFGQIGFLQSKNIGNYVYDFKVRTHNNYIGILFLEKERNLYSLKLMVLLGNTVINSLSVASFNSPNNINFDFCIDNNNADIVLQGPDNKIKYFKFSSIYKAPIKTFEKDITPRDTFVYSKPVIYRFGNRYYIFYHKESSKNKIDIVLYIFDNGLNFVREINLTENFSYSIYPTAFLIDPKTIGVFLEAREEGAQNLYFNIFYYQLDLDGNVVVKNKLTDNIGDNYVINGVVKDSKLYLVWENRLSTWRIAYSEFDIKEKKISDVKFLIDSSNYRNPRVLLIEDSIYIFAQKIDSLNVDYFMLNGEVKKNRLNLNSSLFDVVSSSNIFLVYQYNDNLFLSERDNGTEEIIFKEFFKPDRIVINKNSFNIEWDKIKDSSGVKAIYYAFDKNPDTVPDVVNSLSGDTTYVRLFANEDGVWYFHIYYEDLAGNKSKIIHKKIEVDTVAPPSPVVDFSGNEFIDTLKNIIANESVIIKWDMRDDVDYYIYSVSPYPTFYSHSAMTTRENYIKVNLKKGRYFFHIQAVDRAGNYSPVKTVEFYIKEAKNVEFISEPETIVKRFVVKNLNLIPIIKYIGKNIVYNPIPFWELPIYLRLKIIALIAFLFILVILLYMLLFIKHKKLVDEYTQVKALGFDTVYSLEYKPDKVIEIKPGEFETVINDLSDEEKKKHRYIIEAAEKLEKELQRTEKSPKQKISTLNVEISYADVLERDEGLEVLDGLEDITKHVFEFNDSEKTVSSLEVHNSLDKSLKKFDDVSQKEIEIAEPEEVKEAEEVEEIKDVEAQEGVEVAEEIVEVVAEEADEVEEVKEVVAQEAVEVEQAEEVEVSEAQEIEEAQEAQEVQEVQEVEEVEEVQEVIEEPKEKETKKVDNKVKAEEKSKEPKEEKIENKKEGDFKEKIKLSIKYFFFISALVMITVAISSIINGYFTINNTRKNLAVENIRKAEILISSLSISLRDPIRTNDDALIIANLVNTSKIEDILYTQLIKQDIDITDGKLKLFYRDNKGEFKQFKEKKIVKAVIDNINKGDLLLISPKFDVDELQKQYSLYYPVLVSKDKFLTESDIGKKIIGIVRIDFSTERIFYVIDAEINRIVRTTLFIFIIMIALGILGAATLAYFTVKPIKKLVEGAKIVAGGNLDYKIGIETNDEIGRLTYEFNLMTAKLKQAQEEIIKKKVLEEQFTIAEGIQRSLIPQGDLILKEVDITGFYKAALGVGGDYFDFFKIDDDKVAVILSDVSGKGIPASLMMVNIRTVFKTYIKTEKNSPSKVVSIINNVLAEDLSSDMFATLFFYIYNKKTKDLVFCNAGHGPLCYYSTKTKKVEIIKTQTMPIGIMPNNPQYSDVPVKLSTGDIVVVFTDGVTEAMNEKREEFTEERLFKIIEENANLSSKELNAKIIDELSKFVGTAPQHDDISLIVMKVK